LIKDPIISTAVRFLQQRRVMVESDSWRLRSLRKVPPPNLSPVIASWTAPMHPVSDPLAGSAVTSVTGTGATHRIDSAHPARAVSQTAWAAHSAVGRSHGIANAKPQNPARDPDAIDGSGNASVEPCRFIGDAAQPLNTRERFEQASLEADTWRPPLDSSQLCMAHAEDLLDQIQRLSEDLDARSAKLHADMAVQERRERAFRLWAQQRSEEIRHKREACDKEEARLLAQARRLALTSESTGRWDR